ncbi:MlaC/ttg2D family ABC transporter substrate-binding protein [Desulfovermiculus halophilus]|jgi:phospholipid transport system substrate-binding protein|uniref:MlaC/ttg2D family ABC transporter substrate-binding protein n=1 Tax=Desulfovermiculus halophilus TaxID=339722 RepID=UPI0006871019|nr:ABC transporter substrate-binding protein [Desulfovermiculus halophilus]
MILQNSRVCTWRQVAVLVCAGLLLNLGWGVLTWATAQEDEGPAPIVRAYYDKVLSVLDDQDLNKDELRAELQSMAREVFSFRIMGQMSLGRNWRGLNAGQQQEFVDLFTRLLENTYFQKIEQHLDQITGYTKDDMQVSEEIIFSSRKAEVQTKIVYNDKNVPVNYRFVKLDQGWKIYDVLVEEVSLVQNYRSQFNDALQNSSVQAFMQDMRDKVQELEDGEDEQHEDEGPST